MIVSDQQLPPDEADVKQLSSQLNDGLRSCHSVVANYRTLLSPDENEVAVNDNEAEDRPLERGDG